VKRISPATVTFGVMAIVLGLVAAYVVRQALHKPPVVEKPAPPAPQPPVAQAVFARNVVPKNTRLTSADVFMGPLPANMKRPAGTFAGVNLIVGRITKETVAPGKLIREEHLLGLDESLPDLSDRLPAGHRAVTIIVQGAETGGKRLAEGDRIDIALTVEGTHPDLGEVQTRTLMQNVLVVDSMASRPLQRGTRRTTELDGSSITVAVRPADANKLLVAQRTGILQATLVSSHDTDPADEASDPVSRRQLLGLKEIVPPKRFTVEKWTGNTVQIIEMSDARIRESRDVSSGRRDAAPASRPVAAPASDEVSRNLPAEDAPSGVKVPGVLYSIGEEPLVTLAADPLPSDVK
jgi:pilus assembly protein CpaB